MNYQHFLGIAIFIGHPLFAMHPEPKNHLIIPQPMVELSTTSAKTVCAVSINEKLKKRKALFAKNSSKKMKHNLSREPNAAHNQRASHGIVLPLSAFLFADSKNNFIALLNRQEIESSMLLKDLISHGPAIGKPTIRIFLDALAAQALTITKEYLPDEYRYKKNLFSAASYKQLLRNKTVKQLVTLFNASNYLNISALEKYSGQVLFKKILSYKKLFAHTGSIFGAQMNMPPVRQLLVKKIIKHSGLSAFWQIYAQSRKGSTFILNGQQTEKVWTEDTCHNYMNTYWDTTQIGINKVHDDHGSHPVFPLYSNKIEITIKDSPVITLLCNKNVRHFELEDNGVLFVALDSKVFNSIQLFSLTNPQIKDLLKTITVEQALLLDIMRKSPLNIFSTKFSAHYNSLPGPLKELVTHYHIQYPMRSHQHFFNPGDDCF